jgi:hypothetical protein
MRHHEHPFPSGDLAHLFPNDGTLPVDFAELYEGYPFAERITLHNFERLIRNDTISQG